MKTVFIKECAADNCKNNNTGKGSQMCKQHEEMYENGKPFIASSCQGLGASVWWPNKDHMYDEVDSMLISVNVPKNLMNVSNGRLRKIEEFFPVVVGEWSLGLRPNEHINEKTHDEAMSKYASAQLEAMRECTGHIFWAYRVKKPNSGWHFRDLVDRGIIDLKEFKK